MIVRPLRPFNEFLKDGIVRRQFPDKERANISIIISF